MKRFIKWLINCFVQWVGKMPWQEKVGFTLGGVLGISIGILIFISFDKVPVTSLDYKPLEEQTIAVQQNPEILIETDCDINVNGEVITINFENDECWVTAKYNENFEMISSSRGDKYTGWIEAFTVAVLCGVITFCGGSAICTILIYALSYPFLVTKRKSITKSKKT